MRNKARSIAGAVAEARLESVRQGKQVVLAPYERLFCGVCSRFPSDCICRQRAKEVPGYAPITWVLKSQQPYVVPVLVDRSA